MRKVVDGKKPVDEARAESCLMQNMGPCLIVERATRIEGQLGCCSLVQLGAARDNNNNFASKIR